MRGQILVFNPQREAGVIIAANGQRMLFPLSAWQDLMPPETGMSVEFTLDDNGQPQHIQMAMPAEPPAATPIAVTQPAPNFTQQPKRKSVLTLLAIFLGSFGAHRFYMGAWGWGLVQLLGINTFLAIMFALLPPVGGLLYLAFIIFIWVEAIRYIWMTDAQFDAKLQTWQASRPGPFSFFW